MAGEKKAALILILVALVATSALVFLLFQQRRQEVKLKNFAKEIVSSYLSKGVKPVKRKNVVLKGKGLWVWGSTVSDIGTERFISICKELGIKHIFLLVKGTSGQVVYTVIKEVLPAAHREGMYVHAWFVCFVDRSWGEASPDNGAYVKYLLEIIARFLVLNASGHFIDGVHLDYVRFSGFASHKWKYVSFFVSQVRYLIDHLAPGAVLSIASKAEDYSSPNSLLDSALFYGQNYTDLAKYVDLFCPMTYHLDYDVSPECVAIAAQWIKEITGKPVFAGVQTHPSEHPATKGKTPTASEIETILKKCTEMKIDGVVFFALHTILEKYDEYKEVIAKYYNTN